VIETPKFTSCLRVRTKFVASSALDGLALDATRQTLYYADAGIVGRICSISTDGSQHRVLVQGIGMKPRSIVIDYIGR
jgi:hypothetical protein